MDNTESIVNCFFDMKSRNDIANVLGIKESSLRYFLYAVKPKNMYHTFEIKKKNGELREINAPYKELKTIQIKLLHILEQIYIPKICTMGFVSNKSILDNADKHIKKSEILNVDLKDFFGQFHFGRVRGMFMAKPYSFNSTVATTLAQIVCCNGKLPQGAPTSPILTNMICSSFDNDMMKFSKKHKITYSRYADDITLSGYKNSIYPSIVCEVDKKLILCEELTKIFNKNSFVVNENKIHLKRYFDRQEVTGLVVNKKPNVKREYTKEIRAILHNIPKYGCFECAKKYESKYGSRNPNIKKAIIEDNQEYVNDWFMNVLNGKINYIAQIRGKEDFLYLSLAKKYNDVFSVETFDVSFIQDSIEYINSNLVVVEDKIFNTQGSGFFAEGYGLFTSYHVVQKESFYNTYTAESYKKGKSISLLFNDNMKYKCELIDYALFDVKLDKCSPMKIGSSSELKIGSKVTIAGFPHMNKGDTVTIQTCAITGKTTFLDQPLYKVDGRIVHGMSGGVVLNSDKEIVGIIKAGVESMEEVEENDIQGFIPIDIVIDDIIKKSTKPVDS